MGQIWGSESGDPPSRKLRHGIQWDGGKHFIDMPLVSKISVARTSLPRRQCIAIQESCGVFDAPRKHGIVTGIFVRAQRTIVNDLYITVSRSIDKSKMFMVGPCRDGRNRFVFMACIVARSRLSEEEEHEIKFSSDASTAIAAVRATIRPIVDWLERVPDISVEVDEFIVNIPSTAHT